MQSDCLTVSPLLISSYAWKAPEVRQGLFGLAEISSAANEKHDCGTSAKLGHSSLSWKAYLALREFQHLASDLAEAVFGWNGHLLPAKASESSVLTEGHSRSSEASNRGLLAPVLADGSQALAA